MMSLSHSGAWIETLGYILCRLNTSSSNDKLVFRISSISKSVLDDYLSSKPIAIAFDVIELAC
jgi:hypothetical protein